MKTASALLTALLVAQAAAHVVQGAKALSVDSAPAPAPAGAPGPAPGPAAVQALVLTFEIKNYNYYDLTKQTCPQAEPKPLNAVEKGGKKGKKLDIEQKALKGLNKAIGDISKDIDHSVEGHGLEPWTTPGEKPEPLPWMKGHKASMLQSESEKCVVHHSSLAAMHTKSDSCMSVMDVFRSALTEVVRGVLKCTFEAALVAGAPAPAPAVSAPVVMEGFLQQVPPAVNAASPGPAAPASLVPGPPDVGMFVTFSPGREIGNGRTVNVEITFTDTPENGVDDVALTQKILQYALDNGILTKEIKKALQMMSNIKPKLGKVKMEMQPVEAWDVAKCEKHVASIVKSFSVYYTREHVPMAMFNECTNFMTRMSFSHDYVLDNRDTEVCRKATKQFAKHWNFGEKAKPEDFQLMCVSACEHKYGDGAPHCNVNFGDALAGKPLL